MFYRTLIEATKHPWRDELIDDITAKALLAQALPGWEWGSTGAGDD